LIGFLSTSTVGFSQDVGVNPVGPTLDQRLQAYFTAREEQMGRLADGYGRALETQFERAADAGSLPLAAALKRERENLEALRGVLVLPGSDLVAAAIRPSNLPDLPADAPALLVQLRGTWTTESAKIDGPLADALVVSLQKLETDLTKARDLEGAGKASELRMTIQKERAGAKGSSVTSAAAAAPAPAGTPVETTDRPGEATLGKPFQNSLKMRFIPVVVTGGMTAGKSVLFSVWETRISDYADYAKRNRDLDQTWATMNISGYPQDENHPATSLTWADARGFGEWLTEKERRGGQIGLTDRYRLPSDHEWSCAAGIGDREDPSESPVAKRGRLQELNWWGEGFPPPQGFGNYCGEETTFRTPISGYRDGFPVTAPVGSFPKDLVGGLYDMGGNAAEWCEDLFAPTTMDRRSLRGGSWARSTQDRFMIANRFHDILANDRQPDFGFRVVLELGAGQ